MNKIITCISASTRISLIAEQSKSSILALFSADPCSGPAAVLTVKFYIVWWTDLQIIMFNDELRRKHGLWESFWEWF